MENLNLIIFCLKQQKNLKYDNEKKIVRFMFVIF